MVQEFHVLRCFSCQTFQVQQVKKSKNWACKVCGEKQSLVKEFGRGAAVDCRRHVQKLNALRGRLEDTHTHGSQREQDDEDEEDVHEGLDRDQENTSQEVCHHVSRWSKYSAPTSECPDEEEEEEEDPHVYTETQRFRSQGTRKRKKVCGVKCSSGPYDVCEEQESWTGCSGFNTPDPHDRRFSSGSGDTTHLPSSRQAVYSSTHTHTVETPGYKPAVAVSRPSVAPPAPARHRSEQDSRWDQFLRAVRDEEEEDEAHTSPQCRDNTLMEECEERRAPPDDETCVWDVPADGRFSSEASGHTHTHTHTHTPSVWEPANTPTLPYNPLFLTEEDFDDTF
ncbi:MRN complex-interacting protein [Siphateles boraxobius]|uniref:MRN complex-interacting protein n=1 Tax=Siphateles boraxobius TaxID=180520 RepID=UPI004064A267